MQGEKSTHQYHSQGPVSKASGRGVWLRTGTRWQMEAVSLSETGITTNTDVSVEHLHMTLSVN